MTKRRRPRVTVKAADSRLSSLIAERLRAFGDLEIVSDDAGIRHSQDAIVEAETESLSGREVEVLGLLARGLANKQIGAELGITTHTAKSHVESLLRKLAAANRAEAVMEGIRRGLIGL